MKQDQDLRAIIASHEAELTDMERDIAQYFLSSEARQHSLSSSRVTELLHVSKAALTRFSQKCGFSGYREFVYHFNEETKNQKQVQEHDELTLSVLQRYHHILTDQDGFAWTTSILDSSCLVIGFSLSGGTNSITDSLLDAKEKGAKTVLVTANPAAIHQGFTEVLPAAPLPSSTYIDRISAILPLLIVVDLIYAHFLNKSREQKEIVFNSYWENKKLSSQRSRKS